MYEISDTMTPYGEPEPDMERSYYSATRYTLPPRLRRALASTKGETWQGRTRSRKSTDL